MHTNLVKDQAFVQCLDENAMLLHSGYWQCKGYASLTLQGVHLPLLTSATGLNLLFYRFSTVQRQRETKFVIHRMSRNPTNLMVIESPFTFLPSKTKPIS